MRGKSRQSQLVERPSPAALVARGVVPTIAIGNQPFESHEEILVRRGWKSLSWSSGDRQRIFIVRTPGGKDRRRLNLKEFGLARAVAVGFGPKQAAAESGLEWATARTVLNRCLRKLDLLRCAQLPAFWHCLGGLVSVSRAADGTEVLAFQSRLDGYALRNGLTSAEREVLHAVLIGLDNPQIARHRDTSVRTVANQLARLFEKFGASSKGELASKALLLHASRE